MRAVKKQDGFTLIEIMVAVAILAIISLLLWQTSAVMVGSKARFEAEDLRFHEVALALTRMADDLSMAFLYQSEEHLGSTGGGEFQREIQFIGEDDGNRDKMHFATMSNVRYIKDSKEDEQAEVSYFLKPLEEDENSVWNLIKRVQSPPDRNPEEGGIEYIVLEDVKEFKLRFYDSETHDWSREWDSSSVNFGKKLPRAVEITIVVNDPVFEEETRSFITTALLEMAPGPNDF